MIITAKPARVVDTDTFADLTPVAVTDIAWVEDQLAVTFASDLTPAVADGSAPADPVSQHCRGGVAPPG